MVIVGYFEYQPHIAPACIDLAEDPTETYPKDDTMALVAGWGFSKAKGHWAPSDTLQSFEIPVVNFTTCQWTAPWEFIAIHDKVTILYYNFGLN